MEKCIGVINLDTVGRLGDKKLLVLNSNSASEWKHIFMGCGYVTGVEADMVTQDLDASDQKSFIEAGVPAVQIFSGPHADYHRPTDTADKIDGEGLVKVASFVKEALLYLAEREEPMSFAGKKKEAASGTATTAGSRRASTGSMPDFAFSGEGVRIGAVSPGSPAETAGLLEGDIIVRLGGQDIANLKEYSDALKTHQPGDTVELTYLRDGAENTVSITLGER
jgi:aminopeptidase N